MRRICLSVTGMFLMFFHSFAQSPSSAGDDYKSLNLKVEDVNIVSGYYSQNGNHSPVTGGTGTQQLTDISNTISLKLVNWDLFNHKHSYEFELGIDHHSAASSAYVSKTGASRTGGTRIYPSYTYRVENEEKRTGFGLGVSYSHEYTYVSYGGNLEFSKKSKDNNREFDAKAHIYLDRVKLVEPSELRPAPVIITSASSSRSKSTIPSSPRNTFDISLSLSQVINQRMQIALLADGVAQQGYLGLPFYRVYFNDGSVHIENMPGNRYKLPLGIRLNYFIGDKLIVKSYYRFYTDSWGITSHTASLETPFKITPFVSISPFYRYYIQTKANFFGAYGTHTAADQYYSSDYDFSALSSDYEGLNLRIAPPKGLLGAKSFNALEIRYGHYRQTTGLSANNISLNLTFK
ncbi:MAG: DUF3570 domain-containing protein [Bacteroidota bacterium]|nr:DUF3570 domain-containing protein [Bacteroidota bacterium]